MTPQKKKLQEVMELAVGQSRLLRQDIGTLHSLATQTDNQTLEILFSDLIEPIAKINQRLKLIQSQCLKD